MAPKAQRSGGVDLTDKEARQLLSDHIKVVDCTKDRRWAYEKAKHSQGPSWPDLWRNRHFLGDLLILTKGHLLKPKAWERQVVI